MKDDKVEMTLNNIADRLISSLQSKGIHIMRYNSYSTCSIYLKLDYGCLYSLRISDHKGKSHLNYRFNVIYGYKGPSQVPSKWGWNREIYDENPESINDLFRSIIKLKNMKLISLGSKEYYRRMHHNKQDHRKDSNGFWSVAKDLSTSPKGV